MNVRRHLLLLLLCAFRVGAGRAQQCPQEIAGPDVKTITRTLSGELIFHNSLRQWFELKLDTAQCGQHSIELVRAQKSWTPLQVLRGCHVEATGYLGTAGTGYYSLPIYEDVDAIRKIGACEAKSPFPDYSARVPVPWVRHYRVEMRMNYGPGDHPIHFSITTGRRILKPWQAYASYDLTGGFVLYGYCGKGFVVDRVFGTKQAKPSQQEVAAFDPENAASAGIRMLMLGYTCVRAQ